MVSDGLHHRSLLSASITFGVVALVLVLALLAQSDIFGRLATRRQRRAVVMALTLPLLVTVLVTLAIRVERFVH